MDEINKLIIEAMQNAPVDIKRIGLNELLNSLPLGYVAYTVTDDDGYGVQIGSKAEDDPNVMHTDGTAATRPAPPRLVADNGRSLIVARWDKLNDDGEILF